MLPMRRNLSQILKNHAETIVRDPNPEMVDARQAPLEFPPSSACVYRDFVTAEEAGILADDLKACLKRYEAF